MCQSITTIEQIDPNFKLSSLGSHTDVVFQNVEQAPFSLHGLMRDSERGCYVRLPIDVAEKTNEGVAELAYHLAGGRVRFRTDSPYVAIRTAMHHIGKMPHFALTGSAGFDLYYEENGKSLYDGENGKSLYGGTGESLYGGTFIPPFDMESGYTSLVELGETASPREILIHFPLYSGVKTLEIGLKAGSKIAAPRSYRVETPVVYYGSSITQGGCASRPGMAYQNIISRRLDCDHINLGFSGSARGEKIMADYLAGLEASVFVLDYDHNAPTVEHLEKTHEPMFLRIRESHPDTPILLVSRPKARLSEEEKARRAVILRTFENARARGDQAVFFVDGSLLGENFGADDITVDGSHPTDLGFFGMADGIGNALRRSSALFS